MQWTTWPRNVLTARHGEILSTWKILKVQPPYHGHYNECTLCHSSVRNTDAHFFTKVRAASNLYLHWTSAHSSLPTNLCEGRLTNCAKWSLETNAHTVAISSEMPCKGVLLKNAALPAVVMPIIAMFINDIKIYWVLYYWLPHNHHLSGNRHSCSFVAWKSSALAGLLLCLHVVLPALIVFSPLLQNACSAAAHLLQ